MNYWSKSNLSEKKGKISDGFKSAIFIQDYIFYLADYKSIV